MPKKKIRYRVDVAYPGNLFLRNMHDFENRPEAVIDKMLKQARLPQISGSGFGGHRDFNIIDLKSMKAVYKTKKIIRHVFKNRNIRGYYTEHSIQE